MHSSTARPPRGRVGFPTNRSAEPRYSSSSEICIWSYYAVRTAVRSNPELNIARDAYSRCFWGKTVGTRVQLARLVRAVAETGHRLNAVQ